MTETSRRVALVTGGSRGIGRAIATRLAADGFAVAVGYASREDEALAAVAEIERAGSVALPVRVDVADAGSVVGAFDAVEERLGQVDVVVNSAGIMTLAPIASLDLAELDRIFAINVRGSFAVTQQAARRLRDGGAVVLLSSSVVRLRPPTYGAYTASKAAVEALVPTAAKELGARGITVNAIAPGPVETDLFLDSNNPESIARLTQLTPLGRLGATADIPGVVSLLAGQDGRWINAQVIGVNGGLA